MVAGADFGVVLAWVVAVGAVLKLGLNEGLARWQLATGTTLLEGWCRSLPWPFHVYLVGYLAVWSFVVAGGLMSACGVAAHALVPAVSIRVWGLLHSAAAAVLVLLGGYGAFERVMKVLVAVMVATLLASVALVGIPAGALRGLLLPSLPSGSAAVTLGLMGGVGGSVTLLSYGYWIRERGWSGPDRLATVRLDLAVGYGLTAAFGIAMMLLAAAVLAGAGGMPPGSAGLVACGEAIGSAAAARFGEGAGTAAGLVFLGGVWAAVLTSTLGVWQGVPYLLADYLQAARREYGPVDVRGRAYRGFVLRLAVPPAALLFLDRPVWVIRLYTLTGGLFMPVLAATLLWMTTRRRLLGELRAGPVAVAVLSAALLLFVVVAGRQVLDLL